jgi:hypothetical protein
MPKLYGEASVAYGIIEKRARWRKKKPNHEYALAKFCSSFSYRFSFNVISYFGGTYFSL